MIALENTTMVQVTFFGYAVQGAVGLFMLIALGVGVVLGIPADGAGFDRPQFDGDAKQAQNRPVGIQAIQKKSK
jgi:hypothetical protein